MSNFVNEYEIPSNYSAKKKEARLEEIKTNDWKQFLEKKEMLKHWCLVVPEKCPYFDEEKCLCGLERESLIANITIAEDCAFFIWNESENARFQEWKDLSYTKNLQKFFQKYGDKKISKLNKEIINAIIATLNYGRVICRFNNKKGNGIFEIINKYNRTVKYFSKYETSLFIEEIFVEVKRIIMRFNIMKQFFQTSPATDLEKVDKKFKLT